MAYETKLTRLTPAADISFESLELQVRQKLELEQLEQYMKENNLQETELRLMSPEMVLEAFGHEMLYTIWKNKQKAEEESTDRKKQSAE